jgi:hypothetical protein
MKLCYLILALSFLSAQASMAEPKAATEQTLGQEVEKSSTEGKKFISKYVRSFSADIDHFFSSRRTSYLTNNTQLRFAYLSTVREYEGYTGNFQVGFNINLPQTEKKVQLVFEKKPRKLEATENPAQTPPIDTADTPKQSQTAASIRYLVLFTENTSVSTDGGFQFENPAQPFSRTRVSRSFLPMDVWELRFSEEAYYFFTDKWRFVTSFDSDNKISDRFLFRFANELTWNQVSMAYEYLYGPSFFHKLSDTKAMGYHFRYLAKSQPTWQNVGYSASIVYRQLIFKDWFYFEIIPAVDFPRSRDWQATPSISGKLEVVF